MQDQLIKIEPLIQQIQAFVPEADTKTQKAVDVMAEVVEINDLEDREYAEELLGRVKASYDKFSALRKSITEPIDKLKEELMVFEKRVSYDGKQDNHYTRIRKLIQGFDQAELNRKRKIEEEAEKRRKVEDSKIDIERQCKKNLAQMLIDRVVDTDEGSKKYFDAATLEDFDAKADQFRRFKPVLKQEIYNKCFEVLFDMSLFTQEDFTNHINSVKTIEPYEKWRDAVIESIAPVLNDWMAKIPDLKQEKIALANAKDEEARQKLQEEQNRKSEEEQNRKSLEIQKLKDNANQQIDDQAEIDKTHNAFQQQGSVQDAGPKGPVKKVLVFTDDQMVPKALANIMYHCFLSPKFPGIYKLDKAKKPVENEFGDKELNEHISWFVEFFLKNCNAVVAGTKIKEQAKVIIRK